ncbi:MAG: MarR family transcriptional regulator, partial [Clostridia bacterium]|nr:MarR family transcriptional regulator [Clostridia bacterium]
MTVEKGNCAVPDDGRIHLIRRFQAIGHKLKRLGDENLAEKGLTFSQLRVLAHLLRRRGEDPVLQRELEEALGIRRSSVTALLQNLE